MSDPAQLDDLLDQWEDAREQGQTLSAEQLCHNSPELLTPLKQKIAALEAFERYVSKREPAPSTTPQDHGGAGNAASEPLQNLSYHSQLVDLVLHERGGLGVVYRGTDEKLNRNVAIKFIQSRHARNANLAQRFLQEAEITGRLDHPGVVPVYAIGETETGQPFYSMRFIRGESLDHQLRGFHAPDSKPTPSQRRLRLRQMLTSMVSVCRTIAYAHTRGIVHRDIKPQNIMLGKYGEALIVDWGLALPIDRESRFRVTDETTLRLLADSDVRPDMGEGTPVYMSPEQAVGDRVISPASDIYSLGVTLYKVLTGHLAFDAKTAIEVRSKIINGDFPPPRIHEPRLEQSLQSICLKAMSLEPVDRYATAGELADDLENWLADNRVVAHHYSRTERVVRWGRRNLGWLAGLASGIMLLSVGVLATSGYVMNLTEQKIQLQGDAVRALQLATVNQRDSIDMTCRVAAKSIRLTMEASVAAIEDLAAEPEMVELLSADDSERSAEKRQQQLEALLTGARCADEQNLNATSWFVLDRTGMLLARSSDSPSRIKLNQPMWTRLYYHGGDDLLSSELTPAERPQPIARTTITPIFIGKGKGWQLCSISAPVKDRDQRVVGIVGMTMQAGRFDPAEQLGARSTTRRVSLVETRGQWAGRLVHHPFLKAEGGDREGVSTALQGRPPTEPKPPKKSSATVSQPMLHQLAAIQADAVDPILLDDYVDPVDNDATAHWVAVARPVRVRSRSYGWLKTGWYLIVQDLPYEIGAR